MRSTSIALLLLLLLLLLLPMSSTAGPNPPLGPSETAYVVGDPFPDMAFPSARDGKPLSIRQFRGKKLILHIFASW